MELTSNEDFMQWVKAYYPAPKYRELPFNSRPTIPYDEDQSLIEQLAVCTYAFLFSARRDDDKRTDTAEQEARRTDIEVQIALVAAFPEARGSRIEASQIYALNHWTEAYGYE